jgi:hypothetical protein
MGAPFGAPLPLAKAARHRFNSSTLQPFNPEHLTFQRTIRSLLRKKQKIVVQFGQTWPNLVKLFASLHYFVAPDALTALTCIAPT